MWSLHAYACRDIAVWVPAKRTLPPIRAPSLVSGGFSRCGALLVSLMFVYICCLCGLPVHNDVMPLNPIGLENTDSRVAYLVEDWLEHKRSHGGVQIECEICFEGHYCAAHRCAFIDLTEDRNTSLGVCNSHIQPQTVTIGELLAATNYLSTRDKLDLDAHFYHYVAPLLDEQAKLFADEIRYSTTNRTAKIPGTKMIAQHGCVVPRSLLYRGLRVNERTFRSFENFDVGTMFPSQFEIMCATELYSRGLDYSRRQRPADECENCCGVLLEINGAIGIPIAYLSTHPIEREWRIAGTFIVKSVLDDTDACVRQTNPEEWTARHWKNPVRFVEKWCLIHLDAVR